MFQLIAEVLPESANQDSMSSVIAKALVAAGIIGAVWICLLLFVRKP